MAAKSANWTELATYNSQTYDTTTNKEATDPKWVNVTFNSPGTDAAQPAGTNFALSPGSPAIGYGTVKSWMPASAADVGAGASSLTTCTHKTRTHGNQCAVSPCGRDNRNAAAPPIQPRRWRSARR